MPWNYDVSGSKPLTRVLKRSPSDIGVVMADPPRPAKGPPRTRAPSNSTNNKPYKGFRFTHYEKDRSGKRQYLYRAPNGQIFKFEKRLTAAQLSGW